MGTQVWVLQSHTCTRPTRWVKYFPNYILMGNFLSHIRIANGYLPAGYTGNEYPLPS
jgi:hypothetical protein